MGFDSSGVVDIRSMLLMTFCFFPSTNAEGGRCGTWPTKRFTALSMILNLSPSDSGGKRSLRL
eukprot:28066-Eustigmatos_ZCMA.PRE.1